MFFSTSDILNIIWTFQFYYVYYNKHREFNQYFYKNLIVYLPLTLN